MDGYFYFFFKKHILQISSDLYFILPDPPNLQEIAKHADNQHFHYSHPKPTPNGASLVFMLRSAAHKKMVLRSSSRYAALRKRKVLRKILCLLTADF